MKTIKEFKIEDGATFEIGETYLLKEDVVKLIDEFKPRMNGTMIAEFDCMIEELKARIEG